MVQMRTLLFSIFSCVSALLPQPVAQGLAPGDQIPRLSLTDQNGRVKTFDDIRGPKGAMIVFYRSADW
jgi:hypothetical protein